MSLIRIEDSGSEPAERESLWIQLRKDRSAGTCGVFLDQLRYPASLKVGFLTHKSILYSTLTYIFSGFRVGRGGPLTSGLEGTGDQVNTVLLQRRLGILRDLKKPIDSIQTKHKTLPLCKLEVP